jgi:hypothetical protein
MLTKEPQTSGYALVRQKISSLEKDRKYKFLAEIDGEYKRGTYDTIVEISEENALVRGPLKTIYKDSVTTIEIICSTPKSFKNPHIRLAFFSAPNVFRRVEFIDLVTGENLLSNSSFEKGLSGWEAQGGVVELVKLSDSSLRKVTKDDSETPELSMPDLVDLKETGNDYLDKLFKETRAKWVVQLGEAVGEIDKKYIESLESTKRKLVKENKIAEAQAYDNAIKGGKKTAGEPAGLVKLRGARADLIRKTINPINKKYWEVLKEIREAFQKGGDLAGVVIVDEEIQRLVENYSKGFQLAD